MAENPFQAAIARKMKSTGKGKGNSPKGSTEGTASEEAAESPAFEKKEDAGKSGSGKPSKPGVTLPFRFGGK